MTGALALAGKTALISGGARRLGGALALALADAGVSCVIHYNSSHEKAQHTAEAVRARGVRAWTLQGDLSNSDTVAPLIERAIENAGALDFLVNSASIFHDISFSDMTPDDICGNVAVNAVAPLLMARAFAGQGRQGAIINMLDALVMDYDRNHVPYHLSKRMLQTLTRIMAVEFAPGIRVNAIAPGLILPPAGKDDAWLRKLAHTNPLMRHGGPDDVVDAALFLLRSEFITGQTIYVDGGRHLKGRMYE